MSSAVASSSHTHTSTVFSPADSTAVPWLQLRARIREALGRRSYYVANAQDLSLLWLDERIDAAERRRRITVFAAQHQWRVEASPDGNSARFQAATPSGLFPREILSRNPE
jgi:hypothetical protein